MIFTTIYLTTHEIIENSLSNYGHVRINAPVNIKATRKGIRNLS